MKFRLMLSVFVIFIISMVNAQDAEVAGKVLFENGSIPDAEVILKDTSIKTMISKNGDYSIKNITPGNYRLLVKARGYEDAEQGIAVEKKKTIIPDILLIRNNNKIDEIAITGVSKETLIKESPVAILSISSKQIEKAVATNIISSLIKSAPGLSVVETGPNISKPFIRGLGYNRVLTLYDGIRQEGQQWGDEHGIEVAPYIVEHAEVIKGPASLMYGSDALAGVVSLFPYLPSQNDGVVHGKITGEYQGNNNLIGNGMQLGYKKDSFIASLNASYRMAKNYRNAADGRVYNTNFEEKNFSFLLGRKTKTSFSKINFTLYDNLQGIPDGSRDPNTGKFTYQIGEGEDDDTEKRPVVSQKDLNSYTLSPLHQRIQHYRLYAQHSQQIGKGDLDVQLALQQNIRREYNHPTVPSQPGMYVRLNTLNYGIRYNFPKFSPIELSAGVNGMIQNNKNKSATDFPIPDYDLSEGGFYTYIKWKYKRFNISGGARYDIRNIRWDNFYIQTNPATQFEEHAAQESSHTRLGFASYNKTFGGLSASIGSAFQLTKQISLKANIGRSYRAPNITEIGANGLDPGAHIIYKGNRDFNPEFSLQEDLGISTRFKDFSADVSWFNNNIQNYIYLSLLVDSQGNPLVDAQGNKTYQYQQASAQLYGMEAWLSLHPEKWKGFNFETSLSVIYGFNRDKKFKNKGVQGEYLPLISPLKLSGNLSQKINMRSKLISSVTPTAEVEFSAAQNRYLGLDNTETFTPDYTLFNIGASVELHYSENHSAMLQLQVNNVFDRAYQSHLSRLKYLGNIYNMGRNISLKLIVPF
ncbi:TonB-dependent receptor [Chryseobacterium sp. Tr-659]|uniref:TonB-dependent receptor n=1 Tax=Chryseobacterium sp. Tr-659 TaxID=2608340 RepID=UPI0014243EEC|nr:TonB-dependent receptor [Chryseobacterium sp. Tr-659]NIF05184.1 TonB-dependent receptor [Chryseobacterium sp. Tr-659]